MSKETKVMIGIPTAEFARQAVFYDYFSQLVKPAGTIQTSTHGQSPARGRNIIIEEALKYECSHILFIDDDTLVPPDLLTKLLSHDKDIVTALYLMRNYPHKPIIFSHSNGNGECLNYYPRDGESGLVEVVNCGLGACLIKTSIFEYLTKPYIRLGELEKDHWCDDIGFFNRCRGAGFKIYCDLDLPVGHMATVAIWPGRESGKWFTTYDTFGTGRVNFPMPRPEIKEYEEIKKELIGVGK
jgi:hypothetical protein